MTGGQFRVSSVTFHMKERPVPVGYVNKTKKVNQSHYRPAVAQRVPRS